MHELEQAFNALLTLAIGEDLAETGDISSQAVFSTQQATFRIKSRQAGVIYGLCCIPLIMNRIDPHVQLEPCVADGQAIGVHSVIYRFKGRVASILAAERIILNFLGLLSGIATRTAEFVAVTKELGTTKILDTRKTLPGYRLLAKAAVRAGGGYNHRMGLHDMVMLKDNHIDAAGSITQAIQAVRQRYGQQYRIEVECRTLADVAEALSLAPEVIMLDNMGIDDCVAALALRRQKFPQTACQFEASGDMDIPKVREFAGLGLEYISVGCLTHSVKNFNLSMGIE